MTSPAQIFARVAMSLLLCFLITFTVKSQNTYEDLRGRFMIDLPKGYTLAPQDDPSVFSFTGEQKALIIIHKPEVNSRDDLFREAYVNVQASGLTNLEPMGDINDMEMNGNLARMGTYKGVYAENTSVTLYGMFGGVELNDQGLYFFSILNDKDLKGKSKDMYIEAYQSIRLPGQASSGATNITAIDPELNKPSGATNSDNLQASSEPFEWNHDMMSMSFPAGWSEKEVGRGMPKEVIGHFDFLPFTGANMLVFCYAGMLWSPKTVADVASSAVMAAIPDAKVAESNKIKLENNKKAEVIVYHGTSIREGEEVPLGGVTIVYKSGKCNLNLMGFVGVDNVNALKESMIKVASSSR